MLLLIEYVVFSACFQYGTRLMALEPRKGEFPTRGWSNPRISFCLDVTDTTELTVSVRACLSTLFFDRKCAVETKYSDLIGRDFNYRSLFRRWLRSRPIRSGFLFSTAHFRSTDKVLSAETRPIRLKDAISTYVRFSVQDSGLCS